MAAQRAAATAAAAAVPGAHEEAAVSCGARCGEEGGAGVRGLGDPFPVDGVEGRRWKRLALVPTHLRHTFLQSTLSEGCTCASLLDGGDGDGDGDGAATAGSCGSEAQLEEPLEPAASAQLARAPAGRSRRAAAGAPTVETEALLRRRLRQRQGQGSRAMSRRVVRLANVPLRLMMPKAVENITEVVFRTVPSATKACLRHRRRPEPPTLTLDTSNLELELFRKSCFCHDRHRRKRVFAGLTRTSQLLLQLPPPLTRACCIDSGSPSSLLAQLMLGLTATVALPRCRSAPSAMQIEIRRVLEAVYGLEVEAVATANYEGKKKRGKAGFYRRPDWKKAYVTLRNPVSLPPSVFPSNARRDATASNQAASAKA
eukprot:SM000001S04739  [mRNA]  locus=s1:1899349:1900509:- [translate_table: standard]